MNSTRVVVFTNLLTTKDKALISRIMYACNIDNYDLINAQYYNLIDLDNYKLNIAFGNKAIMQFENLKNGTEVILFPDIAKLHDEIGNEKTREEAIRLIELVKSKLEINTQLEKNVSILPLYTVEQLLTIKKLNTDKSYIKLYDINSGEIDIYFDNIPDGKQGLLFSELVAIKLASELFEVKSWKIL